MQKQIFVVLTDYPFGTNRLAEKLRMSVGLTLDDGNVLNIVFLGRARHALQELDEKEIGMNPITKHVEMLSQLKASFYVEEGGNFSFKKDINFKSLKRPDVDSLLDSADVVIH